MSTSIMSVDPGGTTGVAVYRFVTDELLTFECVDIPSFHKLVFDPYCSPSKMVIERCFIGGNLAVKTSGFEWTGVAKAYANVVNAQVVIQEPTTPDWVKQRFQTRRKSMSQHEWDALAHLLHYWHKILDHGLDDDITIRMIQMLGGSPRPFLK